MVRGATRALDKFTAKQYINLNAQMIDASALFDIRK